MRPPNHWRQFGLRLTFVGGLISALKHLERRRTAEAFQAKWAWLFGWSQTLKPRDDAPEGRRIGDG